MRIHYLITSLERGGAEFSVPDIVQVLRHHGHEVHVFACEPRDRMAEPRLIEAAIPYTLLSNRKTSKVGSILRFAHKVRLSRPDLIWTSLSHATRVGQIVGAAFGIPVVSWKHSADAKRYILRSQRSSRLWIADSEDVARYLHDTMGVEPRRITTWPLFSPTFPERCVARWDGVGPLRIGSAGRLHPMKNYALLIQSMDRLRCETPEVYARTTLSIAGDGPLRDELQGLVESLNLQDNVKLEGWIADIPAYLQGLHLYVQPSAYEGMCIAAHEAMATGLPVIASPVGEMRRSVQPGVTGRLLDGDLVSGIASAIRDFVAQPDTLRAYGENARSYVQRTMGGGAFERHGGDVLSRIERDVFKRRSAEKVRNSLSKGRSSRAT